MAIETSPAFQFYVKDWRSSRAIMRMTFAQRGMYLEMLLEQWESGSLPDCPDAVAHLLGGTVEEWSAAWPTLRRKFTDRRSKTRTGDATTTDHDAQRRIVNLKLEAVRKDKRAWRAKQQTSGRKGGLSKARNVLKMQIDKPIGSLDEPRSNPSEPTNPASEPTANPSEPLANPSSSTSSSTATATSKEERTHTRASLIGNDHRAHAECGRVCIPAFLHRQFKDALGGNEQDADTRVRAWYGRVLDALSDSEPVPSDAAKFWRPLFDAEFVKAAVKPERDHEAARRAEVARLDELLKHGRTA